MRLRAGRVRLHRGDDVPRRRDQPLGDRPERRGQPAVGREGHRLEHDAQHQRRGQVGVLLRQVAGRASRRRSPSRTASTGVGVPGPSFESWPCCVNSRKRNSVGSASWARQQPRMIAAILPSRGLGLAGQRGGSRRPGRRSASRRPARRGRPCWRNGDRARLRRARPGRRCRGRWCRRRSSRRTGGWRRIRCGPGYRRSDGVAWLPLSSRPDPAMRPFCARCRACVSEHLLTKR